ncbi:MAG: anaerobic ribonucleoside-triphosphate reductase activating protein [Rikenellaceae bacterium]
MLKYVSFDIVFQEVPDEVTLAINLSLCPNFCVGCHSPHLTGDIGEELTTEALDALIECYAASVSCVCFMGGDNDPRSVEMMAQHIHQKWRLKTAWYSGRDEFPSNPQVLDYVKLGGYRSELGGLKCPTTNQQMYKLVGQGEYEDITYKLQCKNSI